MATHSPLRRRQLPAGQKPAETTSEIVALKTEVLATPVPQVRYGRGAPRPSSAELRSLALASWFLRVQGDLGLQFRECLSPARLLAQLLIAELFLAHFRFSTKHPRSTGFPACELGRLSFSSRLGIPRAAILLINSWCSPRKPGMPRPLAREPQAGTPAQHQLSSSPVSSSRHCRLIRRG